MNKNQDNTLYFNNITDQVNFFTSKSDPLYDRNDVSYQRGTGQLTYDAIADDIKDFSYLMFQIEHDNKWYYCFIDEVRYLSDDACSVLFTIDYIQTYYFGVNIGDCLIEREHTASDNIGDHTLSENLDTGDLVVTNLGYFVDLGELAICMSATERTDGTSLISVYNGVPSGLIYTIYNNDATGRAALKAKIDAYIASADSSIDAIKNIFMVPKSLMGTYSNGDELTSRETSIILNDFVTRPTSLNGYTPKNNKMFVYPYCFLRVSNQLGSTRDYMYELSRSSTSGRINFKAACDITPALSVLIWADDYKSDFDNYDESIMMSNYPQCAWVGNDFQDWLNRTAINNAATIAGSAVAIGAGVFTANVPAVVGGVIGAASVIGSFNENRIKPNVLRGASSGGVNVGIPLVGFPDYSVQLPIYSGMTVKAEYAKIIDDYFSRFGYKVSVNKTPNFNNRQNFTYVKTIENTITGNIPNIALESWDKALKQGIRFWNNNDQIGDFSLANNPY